MYTQHNGRRHTGAEPRRAKYGYLGQRPVIPAAAKNSLLVFVTCLHVDVMNGSLPHRYYSHVRVA